MPLVAHKALPSYERLRKDGHVILSPERAESQDIRSLHVGLLNMMPDAALAATERQFFRLVSSSNTISQFHMHPFTLPEIKRSATASKHIGSFYEPLDEIKEKGLDALIISGANVTAPNLSEEVFWEPLIKVIDWASKNVTSTLCSCLASHAVLQFRYEQKRRGLSEKTWGVFEHKVVDGTHPLIHDVNTTMHVPHSRFNVVDGDQFRAAGLHVLVEGDEPGVQLAVSPDGFRMVFFQGHPEYDRISLLKEYKREVGLFIDQEREAYPPFPQHYFDNHTKALLMEFRSHVERALASGSKVPTFPEEHVLRRLQNTWHDSGEAVVGNWIGQIYQITHRDRKKPYMDGINPDDPLGWLSKGQE